MSILTVSRLSTRQPHPIQFSAGMVLLIEGLLMFVPMLILGSAINWPASLSDPASQILPLIHENAGAVQLGYFIYLLYSILFLPLGVLTVRVVNGDGPLSPWLRVAVGFAVISTLARALGILRWLFPMPILAKMYVDSSVSATARESIEIFYTAFNAYAGAVGEVLGVSLFAAIWLILVCVAILQVKEIPNGLAYLGFVAAAALLGSLVEIWGVDLGALISVTVALLHVWFLTAAVVFFRMKNLSNALNSQV